MGTPTLGVSDGVRVVIEESAEGDDEAEFRQVWQLSTSLSEMSP
jgi:hypothetical protein